MAEPLPRSSLQRVVDALDPLLVVLFRPPGGDRDALLVLTEGSLQALPSLGGAVEPLGVSLEEAGARVEAGDPALLTALREGQVLHRRGAPRPLDRLLLATRNRGKARELGALLEGAGLPLLTLEEAGVPWEVPEVGGTFEENARLKARAYALLTGLWALADDSGLEVEALGGEPGVHSRRYAGETATDAERVALLLRRLEGVPPERRGARFRCVLAVASPQGQVYTCEGEVRGSIALSPRGSGGFGYDPVFLLPERGAIMAELPLDEKNRVSHRARAAEKMVALLKALREGAG